MASSNARLSGSSAGSRAQHLDERARRRRRRRRTASAAAAASRFAEERGQAVLEQVPARHGLVGALARRLSRGAGRRGDAADVEVVAVHLDALQRRHRDVAPAHDEAAVRALNAKHVSRMRSSPISTPRSSGERATSRSYSSRSVSSHSSRCVLKLTDARVDEAGERQRRRRDHVRDHDGSRRRRSSRARAREGSGGGGCRGFGLGSASMRSTSKSSSGVPGG